MTHLDLARHRLERLDGNDGRPVCERSDPFRQSGDFIDMNTMNVFQDLYKTADWTFTAHVNAGLDVSLGPRTFFTTEARYTWARGPVGADFSGFQRIDLSGLALTFGVGYRM